MDPVKLDEQQLQFLAPKAWADLKGYYSGLTKDLPGLHTISFETLPFEMQLGIVLRYFQENGVELDVCNTSYELLPNLMLDTFENYEKVISHYS